MPRWRDGLANWWAATLHRRFLAEPANLEQFKTRVEHLANDFFTPQRLGALLESYKPVVWPALDKEPDLSRLPTSASGSTAKEIAWETEVDRLLTIAPGRLTNLYERMERPMPFFLGTPLVGSSSVMFNWDLSEDLQGDTIKYDLEISETPAFTSLVYQRRDYADNLMTVRFDAITNAGTGTYYWRVIARDSKNADNWQLAFDELWKDDTRYMGLGSFDIL